MHSWQPKDLIGSTCSFTNLFHAPPHVPAERGVCRVIPVTEKLHTRAHPSYPSFYSRSGSLHSTTGRSNSSGNWPKFHFEIRPKPRFSNRFPRQQIGPNLYNSQLELEKWMRNHTSLTGFGQHRRRCDDRKAPVRTSRARGRSSWFPTGKTSRS
ncbi:hypothetical protein L3X38_041324 [Prunus dulcis]|uniref:Uncharacterized protein n=1 Tax=Prunus dulcis TaxID=3755 RepID=A0AAD4UUJ4_PRUDU|nr:hypothetical protein L3X38_041324 [Prunus dulcis]